MKKIELLAPAGSFEKAKTAFKYGADAVYCGTSSLSLRTRADMNNDDLIKTIKYAHSIGKRVHVTLNIFAWDDKYEEIIEMAKTLEKIVRYANKIGIEHITVYAFSTENWKRAKEEVSTLMALFQSYLDDYSKRADSENIKVKIIGNRKGLSAKMISSIEKCMERTKDNTGIVFNIALNYGGRDEILGAVKNIAKKIQNNEVKIEDITEQMISDNLYTANQPDPDLLIRTSGELRLSNFLPWQLAYTEFLFVDKNWPDFNEKDLDDAIEVYKSRNRKFGAK